MNGAMLEGRALRVNEAEERPQRSGGGGGGSGVVVAAVAAAVAAAAARAAAAAAGGDPLGVALERCRRTRSCEARHRLRAVPCFRALCARKVREMSKESARPGVRITNQFRKREAMVYDLSCEDVRLTIEVAQRPNDDGLGEWMIEAYTRQAAERPTIHEPGPTRNDALRAVARAWAAKKAPTASPSSTGRPSRWRCWACAQSDEPEGRATEAGRRGPGAPRRGRRALVGRAGDLLPANRRHPAPHARAGGRHRAADRGRRAARVLETLLHCDDGLAELGRLEAALRDGTMRVRDVVRTTGDENRRMGGDRAQTGAPALRVNRAVAKIVLAAARAWRAGAPQAHASAPARAGSESTSSSRSA